MKALTRAEVLKTVATPTIWWLLLGAAGIGVVGTLAPLIAADPGTDLLTDHNLQSAMHGAAGGASLVVVAGIIGVAGEWRHGQTTQTFLTTPRRWRIMSAKTIVYFGVGTLYGTVSGVAATVAAAVWYRSEGLALPLERSAVWLTLLGCLGVSAAFGVLGVAIGAVVRNAVVAIVTALAWQIIVEPALFAASPSLFRWLPSTASFALRRQPSDDFLTAGPAAAVLVAFIVGVYVIGYRLVERDDITA